MRAPGIDIDEFRRAGHRVVDLLAEYLETVDRRPLFPDVEPQFLHDLFDEPVPRNPETLQKLLDELEKKLIPYCSHVNHPGYFGLITPTPTPAGIIGDFIASALNQNIGAYTIGPSAVAMERRTVRWLNDLVGYGADAGGNLTSGGTMANFIGLKLARDAVSGDTAQHRGVQGRWMAYVSEERHVSIDKAADAVGIGREGLCALPTDDSFRVRVDSLEQALRSDRARGRIPMCIIGLAGTTNTGSVDDLLRLRAMADREGLWLHVDAAYGGGMLLSERSPGILKGLETADSITLDPHKWFFAPLDAGAILVRDSTRLTASFGIRPSYLTDSMDAGDDRYQYYVHGFEQSRRFRGIKVWLGFKRYGTKQIGSWIDANIEQAHHLYELCAASSDFEPAVQPVMSAFCMRYKPGSGDQRLSAHLHASVARQVEAEGRFWISTTVLKGKTWFRINPVNFRTELGHMDELFALLRARCDVAARSLIREAGAAPGLEQQPRE